MSRIDDLIAELCPNGVEYRKLKQAVDVVPTSRGINRQDYGKGSLFPIVDQGQGEIAGYTDDESRLVSKGEYIVFGDHTRAVKWVDFDFALGADGTKVLKAAQGVIPKFLYYVASNLDIPSRGYNRHWTVARELRVPVPPLEIQLEIVRILDQFTALEAELEAELEARTAQYAFYRDRLLTFPKTGAVRRLPMGEAGAFFGGLVGKSRADFKGGNARYVSYVNVFNNISVDLSRDDFVRVEAGEHQRSLALGDILFTGSSETPGEVGMSAVVTRQPTELIYLNSFSIGYRFGDPTLLNPEFAKHLFRSTPLRSRIVRAASGVTRFNLSKRRLAMVEFPVPTKAEQVRIAAILDQFDAIVNDLSVGLPAELAARRKQYEYYRDKLLTFEEAS